MKRSALAVVFGAAVLAPAVLGATAAHATDVTNPADNPAPITVVINGQTYQDGLDTLPGEDDYACTPIPGVQLDYADNEIIYPADSAHPNGQIAHWTEWDRIAGYQVWLNQQNSHTSTPRPSSTPTSSASSSPAPSSTTSSQSANGTSGTTGTATKPKPKPSPTSSTHTVTSASGSSAHTATKPHSASVASKPQATTDAEGSDGTPSPQTTTPAKPKPRASDKPDATHAPAPSDSPAPAVVAGGSDGDGSSQTGQAGQTDQAGQAGQATGSDQAAGSDAQPVSAVNKNLAVGVGTGDTSVAGLGILAALAVGGFGLLGGHQLRRLGRRISKGARR